MDRGLRRVHASLLEGGGSISATEVGLATASSATAAAVASSFLLARFQSVRFLKTTMIGTDIHKLERPIRAEMGGLAVLLGLAIGSSVYLLADGVGGPLLLFTGAIATIAFAGLVGVADDLLEVGQRVKPMLIVLASVPLMEALVGRQTIFIPTIGDLHLGVVYPLVAVPLAITTSANFANLLAGFNGLEAGCAAISLGTMSLLAYITSQPVIAVLGLILTGAFVGFLGLNWYPAKIFPGDTGTLIAGASLAVLGLAAGLELQAIILSIPAAMDFSLKMMHRRPFKQRHLYGNTSIRPDGTLEPANYPAVVHAFMKVSPVTERGLVASVLSMQALYALAAIAATLVFYL